MKMWYFFGEKKSKRGERIRKNLHDRNHQDWQQKHPGWVGLWSMSCRHPGLLGARPLDLGAVELSNPDPYAASNPMWDPGEGILGRNWQLFSDPYQCMLLRVHPFQDPLLVTKSPAICIPNPSPAGRIPPSPPATRPACPAILSSPAPPQDTKNMLPFPASLVRLLPSTNSLFFYLISNK